MTKLEDYILEILADIIARFIVGAAGAMVFMGAAMRFSFLTWGEDWKAVLGGALLIGVLYGLTGLRKGPGLI